VSTGNDERGQRSRADGPIIHLESKSPNSEPFRVDGADDPTLDEIYVQRFSEMICQAIDARFTFGVDVNPAFGGSKVYGSARGRKECMPKAIVVEEAVHVGT
jgi:hypothetical protein